MKDSRKLSTNLIRWVDIVVVVINCWLLTACGSKSTAAKQVSHNPRMVVLGIDRTGSYALRDQALPMAAKFFLVNAQPGDTWIFRWIERHSYSDRAAIPIGENGGSAVTILMLPAKPANPFDKRAKLSYLVQLRKVVALKKKVGDRLKSLKPPPVEGTDIWSFFKKAEDLKPTDIVAFTDLGDTMRREVPLNLQGVRVWILGFQSGQNPKEAAKRKEYWRKVLAKAGAEVNFHDISQPLPRLEDSVGGGS